MGRSGFKIRPNNEASGANQVESGRSQDYGKRAGFADYRYQADLGVSATFTSLASFACSTNVSILACSSADND
jgi:hypothetical protein